MSSATHLRGPVHSIVEVGSCFHDDVPFPILKCGLNYAKNSFSDLKMQTCLASLSVSLIDSDTLPDGRHALY